MAAPFVHYAVVDRQVCCCSLPRDRDPRPETRDPRPQSQALGRLLWPRPGAQSRALDRRPDPCALCRAPSPA
eukprot:scaffold89804_cov62-Phaeocystis_antarctica.AAC.3